ncbi:MAG: hypothetical protein E7105_06850 [Prevotella sp.]|nr:hypothetical protein [Prevotella sp.]
MQQILVLIILAACVAYTARRLWKRFTAKRGEDDVRCAGCPLADSCQHKMTASDCCCGSGHECCQH